MSCCGATAEPTADRLVMPPSVSRLDSAFLSEAKDGLTEVSFLVPDMHCAGCLRAVETAVATLPGVARALI